MRGRASFTLSSLPFNSFPDHFRFADNHEYAALDGEFVRVGISSFAVDQLGDIVFVDLPDVGTSLNMGESFGSVESVKAVIIVMQIKKYLVLNNN